MKTISAEEFEKELFMTRKPTTPARFLKEDYMVPLGLTPYFLAKEIDVDEQIIIDILNEKQVITNDLARKLAIFLQMDEDFWLNAQEKYSSWLVANIK